MPDETTQTTPVEAPITNAPTEGVQSEATTVAPELTDAQKAQQAHDDAITIEVKSLEVRIKSFIQELMSSDFTVETAGYAQDLFKEWWAIYAHDTKQYQDAIKASQDANTAYLAYKMSDLTSLHTNPDGTLTQKIEA